MGFPDQSIPELRVTDLPISVLVDGVDHFIDFLVGDLAREVHQHILHLISRNAALVIFTEGSESVLEVSLVVQLLGLLLDDQTEVVEVQGAGPVVNLVDQILDFNICRILACSPESVLEILSNRVISS